MYYFCSGLLILILGQSELVLVELKERLCDESPHLEPDVILKKNKVCKKGLGFGGMEGFFSCLEITFIVVSQDVKDSRRTETIKERRKIGTRTVQ